MADRNNIINYAPWRKNPKIRRKSNKKSMRPSGSDENMKVKRIKYFIVATPVLLLLWFVMLVVKAVASGNVSGFLHFYSNLLVILIAACVPVIGAIVGAVQNAHKGKWTTALICALVVYVVIAGLLTACTTELVALTVDKKLDEELADIPVAQTEQTEHAEKETVYEKKRYSFKDDLFIEEVEIYYGIEKGVTDEEALKMRADLILEDIEKEKITRVKREVPKSFWDNWEIADYLYDTYKFQLEEAGNTDRKSILSDLKTYRLDNLKAAKKHRELADEQHEDPDNQHLLALYCVDLCDEYLRDEDINSASAELVEGAEWTVKSIYNAAVTGSKQKAEEGYLVLEKVTERLEKLSGEISGEIIEKIRNCMDAYEIVLQNIK